MRLLIAILLFVLISPPVFAKWVDGYIETTDNVRIEGRVKLPKTEFYTGALYIYGFDLSYFYRAVKFHDPLNGKKIYSPNEIKGFSFNYKGEDYYFISQTINYNSLVKSERQKDRFLNVLYKGSLVLLRDELQLNEERIDAKIIMYENYYLYDSQLGLTLLEVNKESSSLKEILHKYGISELFLNGFNDNLKIWDIKNILYKYDIWLEQHKNRNELSV
jgi:YHS domain-containing protein